jgi:leucyl aminopeptidase
VKVKFADQSSPSELLFLAIGEDVAADLSAVDASFDGQLTDYAAAREFKGKPGTTLAFPTFGRLEAHELVLVGVGERSQGDLTRAARGVGQLARSRGAANIRLQFGDLSPTELGAVIEATAAGNYVFDRYIADKDKKDPIASVSVDLAAHESHLQASDRALIRAQHQSFTRDLVNAPADDIYPETLADAARAIARFDNVTVEVWDEDKLHSESCVGILAVGRASDRKPCLIHVRYAPENASRHVALVGKGVTFDSGGLSLKPSNSMQTMRCDMGGAATVLGAIGAVAELGLPIAVDCFVGAAENMVSGNSYKLGDVLPYSNGVTVEVHNTDAEGRLVLADCLIQACRVEGVTHIVDLATLTGACVVALGPELTGLFTEDDTLAEALLSACSDADEGMWRLPLRSSYKGQLKGTWGQIKNVGSREGGAITAALFLQHFVTDNVSWAHLDIAAPTWFDKPTDGYVAGASGQGVRTLVNWLSDL